MYGGSKAGFYALSRSAVLKRLASKYGMRSPDSFARRFIAGETVEEVVETSRRVQSEGLHITLDYLGESVRTAEEADAATKELNAYVVDQAWFDPWYRVEGNFAADANTDVVQQNDNTYPYLWNIKPKG